MSNKSASIIKREAEFCSGCGGMRVVEGENCYFCNADGKLEWLRFPPQKFIDSGDLISYRPKRKKT